MPIELLYNSTDYNASNYTVSNNFLIKAKKDVFMFSYLYVDYGKARGKGFNGIISPNKKYIGGQRYENC